MPTTVTEGFNGPTVDPITPENSIFGLVQGDPTSGPKFVSQLRLFNTLIGLPRSGNAAGSGIDPEGNGGGSGGRLWYFAPAPVQSFQVFVWFAPMDAIGGEGTYLPAISLTGAAGLDTRGIRVEAGPVGNEGAVKRVRASWFDGSAKGASASGVGPWVDAPTDRWLEVSYDAVSRTLSVNGSTVTHPAGWELDTLDLFSPAADSREPFFAWFEDLTLTHGGDEPPPALVTELALRRFPRDDSLGFGGVGRNYPLPRGRRNYGGQP